ncbi:MAG: WbqC family protein [Lachnospiraceae bacterium]|nr:WbqC family protein [Lachnospiraceae bacterium]
MSLGAMQPYLFPYLGYFQLMNCVQTYVFCGNLQYIKRGWVNRNRVFTDFKKNETGYFTFSVARDDYRKNINQRYYSSLKKDCDKLRNILFQNYKRAPYFEEAYCVIDKALQFQNENVAYFNMNACYLIAQYLGITSNITCTDIIEDEEFRNRFCELDYEQRVIFLCDYFGEDYYINAIGGMSLYHRNIFADRNKMLGFIKMEDISYRQYSSKHISNLSIIDVMMHNHAEDVKRLLGKYQII